MGDSVNDDVERTVREIADHVAELRARLAQLEAGIAETLANNRAEAATRLRDLQTLKEQVGALEQRSAGVW
jgi:flagellar motility protein MotE (MotC chaperone)